MDLEKLSLLFQKSEENPVSVKVSFYVILKRDT